MRVLREPLEERLLDVGVGVAYREPAAVLRVPDFDRDVSEHRLRVLVELERPVAVHDHVELVYLVVEADVHELDPLVVAPELAIEADAPVARVPRERRRDRAHRERRPVGNLAQRKPEAVRAGLQKHLDARDGVYVSRAILAADRDGIIGDGQRVALLLEKLGLVGFDPGERLLDDDAQRARRFARHDFDVPVIPESKPRDLNELRLRVREAELPECAAEALLVQHLLRFGEQMDHGHPSRTFCLPRAEGFPARRMCVPWGIGITATSSSASRTRRRSPA